MTSGSTTTLTASSNALHVRVCSSVAGRQSAVTAFTYAETQPPSFSIASGSYAPLLARSLGRGLGLGLGLGIESPAIFVSFFSPK